MKIQIGDTDCHHRISSARSQTFRAGSEVDVPRATAEALISAGRAKKITAKNSEKPSQSEE